MDKLIVTTAWGDWHPMVPPGMVGVRAMDSKSEESYWYVPRDEYRAGWQAPGGFIVDPARHMRSKPITADA
jgi:hypothetical protein